MLYNYQFHITGFYVENIVIPIATIIYATTVADGTNLKTIASKLSSVVLGISINDNETASFLFGLRVIFEQIDKRIQSALNNSATTTTTTTATA